MEKIVEATYTVLSPVLHCSACTESRVEIERWTPPRDSGTPGGAGQTGGSLRGVTRCRRDEVLYDKSGHHLGHTARQFVVGEGGI